MTFQAGCPAALNTTPVSVKLSCPDTPSTLGVSAVRNVSGATVFSSIQLPVVSSLYPSQ